MNSVVNSVVNGAVLVHGGTMARRASLATALRSADGLSVRVRVSSRAAEAAKCLADPAVVAVFLVDAPDDADAVRAAALARGLAASVYALEPRDTADVVVSLTRAALRVSDRL
ncbi:MAG: hypothetical protein IPP90_05770 [Gemmatimonadaceae bacterium]|nr:hypothetical protein [Gemmatimonadaceae bacterium]